MRRLGLSAGSPVGATLACHRQQETVTIDPLALHDAALKATGGIVSRVRVDQLSLPTPCAEWDVRDLIGHLVDGNEMFTRAAGGGPNHIGETAPTPPPTSPMAEDPFEAYSRTAAAVRQAWRSPGLLEREVTGPFGTVPGRVAILMHFTDHLVHGWDLAKATGQATTIDPALAQVAYDDVTAVVDDEARGPGLPFAAEVRCRPDAPVHERLVAFLGRHPSATVSP